MKKFISLLLTVVLLMGLFPVCVFASVPNPGQTTPVTHLTPHIAAISVRNPAETGNMYTLEFTWTQPQALDDNRWRSAISEAYPEPTLRAMLADQHISENTVNGWSRFASHFEISFRNLTIPSAPEFVETVSRTQLLAMPGVAAAVDNGEILPVVAGRNTVFNFVTPDPLNLMPGSIYQIDIRPMHYVPMWVPNPPDANGNVTLRWEPVLAVATPAPGGNEHRSMLFMTDIEVRPPQSADNAILVEWQNPRFGRGSQYEFPYWRFTLVDGGGREIPIGTVSTGAMEEFTFEGRSYLRHTLSHPSILIGQRYTVRVEPMRNNSEPVRLSPTRPGEIGEISLRIPSSADTMTTFSLGFRRMQAPHWYESRTSVMITPVLNRVVDGQNFVRLHWSTLAPGSATRVVIERWEEPFPTEDPPPRGAVPHSIIAVLHGEDATSRNWWPVGYTPNRWGFTISLWNDVPGRPPEEGFLARSRIVIHDPGQVDFAPYTPIIESVTAAQPVNGFSSLTLEWQPFFRAPHNTSETNQMESMVNERPVLAALGGRAFIDMDISYRIFISDSWDALQWNIPTHPTFDPVIPAFIPSPGLLFPRVNDPAARNTMPVFRMSDIINYTGENENGEREVRQITANNVYFVRIEAIRSNASGVINAADISTPSFGVVYIPPSDDLNLHPAMIDAPPLSGQANRPGETPQITLNWDLRYLEIGDPASADNGWNRWFSSVGVDTRGNTERLIFGRSVQYIPPSNIRRWDSLNNMLIQSGHIRTLRERQVPDPFRNPGEPTAFWNGARQAINEHLGFDISLYPLRIQDMYDRHYRIHVITHAQLMAQYGTLEEAFTRHRDILMRPENDDRWVSIGQGGRLDNGTAFHAFTSFPGVGTLLPNTSYVVFFQPYDPGPPLRRAFYPNYVVVTTPDEFVQARPTPATPVLFPGLAPTDTTVSVRWRVQGEQPNEAGERPPDPRTLFFELRWSETILDYPEAGTFVSWEELEQNWGGRFEYWRNPVTGLWYYHFTINNLFPDTLHYIWARASNRVDPPSGWSNPIEIRTRDIAPPPPPRLGLASRTHLNAYNLTNNTDYEPVEANAVNLSLSRIFSDFREHDLPRASGGDTSGGSAELIDIPILEDIYVIRFSQLVPNRHYYARARTILTVSRGTPRSYSYEIQLSDNMDFLDAITFTIPSLTAFDPLSMKRTISDWVHLEVSTAPSADDFDGAYRPEQFPLPDEDWEMTYVNGVLLWRFRTNRAGADGRPDQQADQRFISRLIDSRVHRYEVDLSMYMHRPDWPVHERVLEIPWTILRAFDERRVTWDINFGDMMLSIPPGAFDTAAVRGLNMGVGSFIRINMHVNAEGTGLPALPMNNRYITLPQRLSVTAVTPIRTLTLNEFALPIEVAALSDDTMGPDGVTRVALFSATTQAGGWRDNAAMRTNTLRPGTFATVMREEPQTTAPNDPSLPAMQRVTARLTFLDMFEYNPRVMVNSGMFNNIINALANNRSTVTMNANLSNAERQSLERARMLAPTALAYESAVDILVRFYELRTRRIIEPITTPGMLIGFDEATPALQQSLLKAADIGFITGRIDPHRALTMGELMVMLDIIITDTGY
jgi:hypothetical protein